MDSPKVNPVEGQGEKAGYDMQSAESRQRLHEKIQKPPGSWLKRTMYKLWYMFYGFVIMTLKLKFFKEICTRSRSYDPGDEPRRPGEVVVITGGPRGIAYELTKKFLQLDFIVIMGCRDVCSSHKKVDEMRTKGVIRGTIHLLPLNLKSLASTKEFAEGVLKITNRIDLLMNNAGIMMTPYECTEDGYEAQFQVNYLSHFLLTLLLLPTIKRTSEERGDDANGCRIVNTTSAYHLAGKLDFDDLETKDVYTEPKCYFDSKLCQVLFTKQLEKRLQQEKTNIHVFAVHPGAIPSELWSNAGSAHQALACMMKPLMPTTEDGADALMYAALSSKLEKKGGSYLEGLGIACPNSQSNNVFFQELLWSRSEFFCQAFV